MGLSFWLIFKGNVNYSMRSMDNIGVEDSWDTSRKEFYPVEMIIQYKGDMQFTATNSTGMSITMEAPLHQGGTGTIPTPIDHLIASLGCCIGVKIILSLSDLEVMVDEFTINIQSSRKKTMPAVFDRVHLVITLIAQVDDDQINQIVIRTLSHYCPIAAMFAEVGEITYEHHITRR